MTGRVYVVWKNPIFRDSLRAILSHPDITWLGATSEQAEALPEIANLKPDIIFVEQEEQIFILEILKMLQFSPGTIQLVGLSLMNNLITVYQKEQRIVVRKEELLQLVTSPS